MPNGFDGQGVVRGGRQGYRQQQQQQRGRGQSGIGGGSYGGDTQRQVGGDGGQQQGRGNHNNQEYVLDRGRGVRQGCGGGGRGYGSGGGGAGPRAQQTTNSQNSGRGGGEYGRGSGAGYTTHPAYLAKHIAPLDKQDLPDKSSSTYRQEQNPKLCFRHWENPTANAPVGIQGDWNTNVVARYPVYRAWGDERWEMVEERIVEEGWEEKMRAGEVW